MVMLDVGYAAGPSSYEIVTILTVPEIPKIAGVQEACHNEPLVFNPETDNATSHNWQLEGIVNSVIAGDSIVVTPVAGAAFTLYLDGTNVCGTSNMDTLVVSLDSLPALFSVVTDPVMHCYGDEIAQAPTSSLNADTIKWYGVLFDEIRNSGPLTYVSTLPGYGYVYVAAENRCGIDVDSILVETHDSIREVLVIGPSEVCSNSLLVLYEPDTVRSNYTYVWSVTDASMSIQDLTDSALVDFTTVSGGVTLAVSNYCNTLSNTIVTDVNNLIDLELEQDEDSVCIGQFSRMRVTDIPGYSYEWFELGNATSVSSEANLTVNSEGQYWVEISFNSCSGSSDTASVDVDYFTNNYDPFGANYYVCEEQEILNLVDLEPSDTNYTYTYRLEAYGVGFGQFIGEIDLIDSLFTLDTTATFILKTHNGHCTNTDEVTIGITEGFVLRNDTVEIAHQEAVVLVTLNDFIWLNQNQYTVKDLYEGSNAEVQIVQGTGVLYDPDDDFSGYDSVVYQINNDFCPDDSAMATVYITVNPGPEDDTLVVTDLNVITDDFFLIIDSVALLGNDKGAIAYLEYEPLTFLGAEVVMTNSGAAVRYADDVINTYVGTTLYDTLFYRLCDGVNCVTAGAVYEVRFPDDSITTVTDPFESLVYNIVSPNGDGINDFLKIEFYETLSTGEVVRVLPIYNDVTIFTKWGDVVYTRSNYSNQFGDAFMGLDLNDEPLPSGTYYYALEYELEGKKGRKAIESVKGFFLLVKDE